MTLWLHARQGSYGRNSTITSGVLDYNQKFVRLTYFQNIKMFYKTIYMGRKHGTLTVSQNIIIKEIKENSRLMYLFLKLHTEH